MREGGRRGRKGRTEEGKGVEGRGGQRVPGVPGRRVSETGGRAEKVGVGGSGERFFAL